MTRSRRTIVLGGIAAVLTASLIAVGLAWPAARPVDTAQVSRATAGSAIDGTGHDRMDRDEVAVEPEPADPDAGGGEPDGDAGEAGGEAEEDSGEELLARDAWFIDQRLGTLKKIPKGAMAKARSQAVKLRTAAALATDPLNWIEVGPRPINAGISWIWGGSTPFAGRVTAIATHPTDANTAYVGTAIGGVWKTTSGGTIWTPVFDSVAKSTIFPSIAVGAVAVDPSNPGTVYVGTGESNYSGAGYFGTGLYVSATGNGGWTKIGGATFDQCSFSSIVVKSNDSRVIVAAVTNGNGKYTTLCSSEGRSGIYRSDNSGTSWIKVLGGDATRVAVSPNDPAVMYAGIYGGGLYRSGDSGQSWTKLTTFPLPANPGRVDVGVAPTGSTRLQTLYAAASTTGGEVAGIYRSNDSGSTWSAALPTKAPFVNGVQSTVCRTQCNYDLTLAVDPSNANRAYFGGVFLNTFDSNVSTLRGWATPTLGSTCPPYVSSPSTSTTCIHTDFHVMTFDASRRLWIGSDGGVYRTSDGVTFANLNNGIDALQFYPGISGSLSTQLVAGAQDNGTSRLAGSSVASLVNAGDGTPAAVVGNGVALTSSQYLSIRKVVNGTACSTGYSDANQLTESGNDKGYAPFVAPLVGSPAASNVAYAGSWYVYRSTNASSTACGTTAWTRISQGFTYSASNYVDLLQSLAASKDGVLVYAGTGQGHIYVGTTSATWTTGATQWPERSIPGVPRAVTDFWISPTSSSTAYATVSGFNTGHVFRTTNAGVDWTNVSGNLPNSPANAVVVDPSTVPATLYVGMDVGVFWSQDGGTTWQDTSIGLPPTIVSDLLLDTASGQLVAATFGRGIYKAAPIGTAQPGPTNDAFAGA
jgi:hypothetical protein